MAIIVNGVNIPTNGEYLTVNGVPIEKVVANDVVVWERIRNIDILNEILSGSIPYTKYEGPDRIDGEDDSGNEVWSYVDHDPYNENQSINSAIRIDNPAKLIFLHSAQGSDDSEPLSICWTMYLEFTYDLTPFKKISFNASQHVGCTTGGAASQTFFITVNSTKISRDYQLYFHQGTELIEDGVLVWAEWTADEDEDPEPDRTFSGEVDISSYNGVQTIRLCCEIYSMDFGNSDGSTQLNSIVLS